jgi:hypothetical protein
VDNTQVLASSARSANFRQQSAVGRRESSREALRGLGDRVRPPAAGSPGLSARRPGDSTLICRQVVKQPRLVRVPLPELIGKPVLTWLTRSPPAQPVVLSDVPDRFGNAVLIDPR